MINISCAAIACSIILSSVKLEKRFSIAERVSSSLLTSPPYPSQRLLDSFLLEPKHRKKKYCHIPDADEHLKRSDYRADGIWQYFFFRLFSLMNQIVKSSIVIFFAI